MDFESLMLPQQGGGGGPVRPPVEMITPRTGLVYKFKDKSGAKVFVNVVMHELVQKPLDASMQEVSDEHLDNRGIANLRVPLDVGDPFSTPDNSGADAVAVDVMLHPAVVARALEGRMIDYYQRELAGLLVRNVQDELVASGKGKGLEATGWKVLKCKYKGGDGPKPFPWVDQQWAPGGGGGGGAAQAKAKHTKNRGASEGLVGPLGAEREKAVKGPGDVVVEEKLDEGELREVRSTRKGEEAKKAPVVKKGFLSGKNSGKLYENEDGSYGSTEQSNTYDPVKEQLKHLPEGLRNKCAIVDTTKLSKDEVKDAMEQYANMGTVKSGPCAPENTRHHFDSMFKKASTAEAPEPTFALGFGDKRTTKSKFEELAHTIASVPANATPPEAYSLTISLPPDVNGMADLEVEVSSKKVEVMTKDGKHALNLGWPSTIDPDAASAKFKRKAAQLLIVVPVASE